MKNKIILWITLGGLILLLTACGLINSKSGVIKCTGTATAVHSTPGEQVMLNGVSHTIGEEYVYEQESDCPEMIGVLTVNVNYITASSIWGTFYYETAYEGGGTFEGTANAVNNPDGTFEGISTSYEATSSLRGLQLDLIYKGPSDSVSMPFEATIRNLPQE